MPIWLLIKTFYAYWLINFEKQLANFSSSVSSLSFPCFLSACSDRTLVGGRIYKLSVIFKISVCSSLQLAICVAFLLSCPPLTRKSVIWLLWQNVCLRHWCVLVMKLFHIFLFHIYIRRHFINSKYFSHDSICIKFRTMSW